MSTSTNKPARSNGYVLCIEQGDYAGELIVGKIYRTAKALRSDPNEDVRVIDESREDYLYPAKWFVPVELPPRAKRALAQVR